MHINRPHIPFFRIFYSTTFTILTLILAAALLITPGDHIYQSFRKSEVYHIFIVAGFYLLTFLISVLVYGGRLYKTRTNLAGIPRDGVEVGGKVGREVQSGLERSAVIAYEAHPRDLRDEKAGRGIEKRTRLGRSATGRQSQDSAQNFKPAWGVISHPGWSSPSSPDLPNLHYEPVILELSNLIEAKAVSLAPPDPFFDPETNFEEGEAPLPDPRAVELLQRPATMGLRDYVSHLSALGMIAPISLGTDFLSLYERARFSGEELNETDFRTLMTIFAEILRNMQPLDTSIVDELHAEFEAEMSSSSTSSTSSTSSEKASFATNDTVQRTPQPDTYYSASSSASTSSKGSQGTTHKAPPRPGATRNISNLSNMSRVTRASQRRGVKTPSMASMRRMRSGTESSGYSARSRAGSVIRLAEARGPLGLPHTIHTSSTEGL
ncbi:hypothetical protein OEA41_005074 [Lepraria neglecta]|uniref:Defect at low temperature protein 1 n=1 Tax=Lepraria neglecta TaxID=209136 RepID=A0AAE0DGC7_9LECA|nr:hypothetical protein OEA41_005074 [Lepraria neglecta]